MSTAERKAIKDAVDVLPGAKDTSILIKQFLCDVNRIADCLEVIAERMPTDSTQPKVF